MPSFYPQNEVKNLLVKYSLVLTQYGLTEYGTASYQVQRAVPPCMPQLLSLHQYQHSYTERATGTS